MRLTLSLRLTLWYALTLSLLLGGFAAFSYLRFHEGLHRDFEHHLAHETRALRPFVVLSPGGPFLKNPERIEAVAIRTRGTYGTYVRLLDPEGRVRYQSPNFEGMPPLGTAPHAAGEQARSQTWNGMPARLLFTPLHDAAGALAGWLVVTGFEWSLHLELDRLASTLALGALAGMLLSAFGGLWLARRALRPMVCMTDAATRIGATDLRARLPAADGVRDELTDLADAFNGLIGRLDEALEREKRFAAHAAHELLTPLATLRAEAEVALRRDRPAEEYRRVLAVAVEDTKRLAHVVHGLLALARAEQPCAPADPSDLGALAREVAASMAARARHRRIALDVAAEEAVCVPVGAVAARTVLANLVDNALKYTPEGGRVHVRVYRQQDGQAAAEVTDTGIGLAASDVPRVFERFFRASEPHVSAQPGSGLGLSVAQALARAHDGEIRATSRGRGHGSTFTLVLASTPCPSAVDDDAGNGA